MIEFSILNYMIDLMERTGTTYKIVMLSIDDALVIEINNANGTKYTLEELERAADKCLAHEWLKHRAMGSKYGSLGITPKGVGVARSRRKAERMKSSRSVLKIISDFIEDHKGIFILLGGVIALATFIVKMLGE